MARLNDEQYASVLMNQLRNDLAQAKSLGARHTVASRMADEVELASSRLAVSDEAKRSMRDLAREVRDELRRSKEAQREPAPIEQAARASAQPALA